MWNPPLLMVLSGAYFMGWYDLDDNGKPAFGEWNTNNEWKTVMDNPLVINRGDVTF